MKTTKIALASVASLLLGQAAMAASSGDLLLKGVVGVVNEIVVSAEGTANTTLDIRNGETQKLVGRASETSNSLTGYTITMSSANGGKLQHTVDSTKSTTYTVEYNGGAAVTPTTAGSVVKNVTSLSGLTTNESLIKVNVVAYNAAPAGTYQDTLTLTIAAQ